MKRTRLLSASCRTNHPVDASPAEKMAANRRMSAECMDRAAAYQPDFVCFPEIILHQGAGTKEMLPLAEPIPGPTSEMMAGKARALNCHVIHCALERDGDRVYNTAALIARDGALVGKYRKYNATGYEMKDGIFPGDEVPVWETDRGRVGCAICFDLKFPAVGLALSRGRAQTVFWPSMFYGGMRLASWAMDYGFYLVRCHATGGAIVDPLGNRIAGEGPVQTLDAAANACVQWTFAEVNTDRKTYHLDFHGEKMRALTGKYGGGVDVQYSRHEGTFSLASNLPDVSVEDLEREFELQDLRGYLDEADDLRRRVLKGADAQGA